MQTNSPARIQRLSVRVTGLALLVLALVAGASAFAVGGGGESPRPGATLAGRAAAAPACPVARSTCRFAASLTKWLRQKRPDLFVAAWQSDGFTCPFPRKPGLGGPYPLCDDVKSKGQIRMGYQVGHWQSEGGWQSGADLTAAIQGWLDQADPSLTDDRGDGALRRFTIGCPKGTTPANCKTDFNVVLSTMTDLGGDPVRVVEVLHVTSDGEAVNARIRSRLIAGGAGAPDAWFEGGSTTDDPNYEYYVWKSKP